jgi:hypothetical protein
MDRKSTKKVLEMLFLWGIRWQKCKLDRVNESKRLKAQRTPIKRIIIQRKTLEEIGPPKRSVDALLKLQKAEEVVESIERGN